MKTLHLTNEELQALAKMMQETLIQRIQQSGGRLTPSTAANTTEQFLVNYVAVQAGNTNVEPVAVTLRMNPQT